MTTAAMPVTLDNCDREPIHIPGHIQAHGALFAFDAAGVLVYRSANADGLLRGSLPALGDTLAPGHFDCYEGFHQLVAAVRESAPGEVIPHAMEVRDGERVFDLIAHVDGGVVTCEFEDSSQAVAVTPGFSFLAHRAAEKLKRQQSVKGLLDTAVEELRRMAGFDRVMAYQFRHDESGDVVAESCDASLDPFVGRRYPASDIPAQARRLYIINTLRLIADVGAPAVPVLAASRVSAPLDMSHAVLRSVSPVHLEYLGNMGVGASMSVSIIIGGKLWGMLACHHMQPRRLPYTMRMACDMLAQILASNLQGLLARDRAAKAEEAAGLRSRLVEKVLHSDDILLGLSSEAAALCEGFSAHAALIACGARMEVFGDLTPAAGQAVVAWLNEGSVKAGHMIYRDTLPAPLPAQLDIWCGMLALPFGAETPGWVVLLRKEQIETVSWGGKPEKEYSVGPLGPRLTPRGSFELWREIVRGRAEPWSDLHLESGQKLLDELVRADAAHNAEINRARSQLMAMLGHDLRDPLQSISNTALLMKKGGSDDKLTQRLQSSSTRMQRLVSQVMDMSRLQSGVLTFELQPVDLVPLLGQLVSEIRSAHPRMAVLVDAPEALTAEADADRISQVISNLLSNARHHGVPDEPVRVKLREEAGTVHLDVSNVGAAIETELAATLFQPFKRNAGRSATNRNGLGLGLYIARQVMAGHGGTMAYRHDAPWVVFSATFPIQQPPPVA